MPGTAAPCNHVHGGLCNVHRQASGILLLQCLWPAWHMGTFADVVLGFQLLS